MWVYLPDTRHWIQTRCNRVHILYAIANGVHGETPSMQINLESLIIRIDERLYFPFQEEKYLPESLHSAAGILHDISPGMLVDVSVKDCIGSKHTATRNRSGFIDLGCVAAQQREFFISRTRTAHAA